MSNDPLPSGILGATSAPQPTPEPTPTPAPAPPASAPDPTPTPTPTPAVSKESLILDIAQIALGVLGGVIPGAGVVVNVAEALIAIEQKARAAYELHVGEPMDPSLVKPETPIA